MDIVLVDSGIYEYGIHIHTINIPAMLCQECQ